MYRLEPVTPWLLVRDCLEPTMGSRWWSVSIASAEQAIDSIHHDIFLNRLTRLGLGATAKFHNMVLG